MDISDIKIRVLPVLQNAGVSRSELFGSTARKDRHRESDIDILVQMPENASLIDFASLKVKLEDVLIAKVDLVTYDAVNEKLRPYIERDALRIL